MNSTPLPNAYPSRPLQYISSFLFIIQKHKNGWIDIARVKLSYLVHRMRKLPIFAPKTWEHDKQSAASIYGPIMRLVVLYHFKATQGWDRGEPKYFPWSHASVFLPVAPLSGITGFW